MAVVDEKLICRLCVEVKEFCVDSLARVDNSLSKNIGLWLPIKVSIIQHCYLHSCYEAWVSKLIKKF